MESNIIQSLTNDTENQDTESQNNDNNKKQVKINLKKTEDKLSSIHQDSFENFYLIKNIQINNVTTSLYRDKDNNVYICTLDYNRCMSGDASGNSRIIDASNFISSNMKFEYPVVKYGYLVSNKDSTSKSTKAVLLVSVEGCKKFSESSYNKKYTNEKNEIYNALLLFSQEYQKNNQSISVSVNSIKPINENNTEEKEENSNENDNIDKIVQDLTVCIDKIKKENTQLKEDLEKYKTDYDNIAMKIINSIMSVNQEPQVLVDIVNNAVKIASKQFNVAPNVIYNTLNSEIDKIIPNLGYCSSKATYVIKDKGCKKEVLLALVNTLNNLYGNCNCLLFAIKNAFKFDYLELSVWYLKQFRIDNVSFPIHTNKD